ncbi:hypothetical protein LTR99_008946 [Exophiala xenobiotica]|nr:hypothetical protein LTR99_008946 [Exophiala xenobiotica]
MLSTWKEPEPNERGGIEVELPLWRLSLLHIMEQHNNDQKPDDSTLDVWEKVLREFKKLRTKCERRN